MTEKEPSWLGKVGGLFDPGGDPEAIRVARVAWLELSSDLKMSVDVLKPAGKHLAEHWDGRAAEAYQDAWKKFMADLDEYVKSLGDAAVSMEKMAEFIEDAQRQARNFWRMVAISLAAGAALAFVTAGFSAAASAAVAARGLAGLAALAARMAFVLSGQAAAMAALQSAALTIAARFAMGMAFSLTSSVFVKGVVQGLDITDPASWNANDFSKLLLDGTLVIGMGSLASMPSVAARLAGSTGLPSLQRQLVGGAVFGAGGSAMFSIVSQFGWGGKSLADLSAWQEVGKSTGVGGVSGLAAAGLFFGAPRILSRGSTPPSVITATAPRMVDVHVADVMRASTGLVSDAINYIINYPEPGQSPHLRSTTDGPAAPRLPKGLPALPDPTPPTVGGGSHTVRRGESLWAIASQVYGDPSVWPRIAAANPQLADPSQINPGDVVRLPELQPALS